MPPPSSATFWSLMERWRVPDDQALELVTYDGKLPDTGKRPRFKLSPAQAGVVSSLLEIDSALALAGIDHAWLRTPDKGSGRTPLDLMRAGEIGDVLGGLRRASFEASVKAPPY